MCVCVLKDHCQHRLVSAEYMHDSSAAWRGTHKRLWIAFLKDFCIAVVLHKTLESCLIRQRDDVNVC